MRVLTAPSPDRSQSNSADVAEFDWAEIGRHNKKTDCWIVIDGAVYDVTPWVDDHPGGQIICALAGEDVSALFHSAHFRDVRGMMGKYRIGRVIDYAPDFSVDCEFLRVLKRRVFQYFKDHRLDYRRIRLLRPQVCLSILCFFACWYLTYYRGWWLCVVPMGLISCAMVGGFAHDYSHSTMFKSGNRSNFVSALCSNLWCFLFPYMSEKHFQYEHLRHHVAPLDAHLDYEVFALRRFLRLSPQIPRRRFFQYQAFYAPLVYAFYITLQVFEGFASTYFHRRELRKDPTYALNVYASWVVSSLFHVAIPIALVGFIPWLVCFVVYNMVWQFSTYLVAAVVHLVGEPETNTRDWCRHVCLTTRNVLCGNSFYDWLSGGFNYQIDHHLLPSIAREYLPQVNGIVKGTCDEFGYPYVEYRSFLTYLRDHYDYLYLLGQPSSATTESPDQ